MIHGNNIIISDGTTALAGAKSCTIKTKCKTIEVSSPMSGTATEYIVGRTSWSLTTNHLITTLSDLLLHVGQSYTITVTAGNETLTGTAICTDCQITAKRFSMAQGTFSFQGTGELSATT